MSYDKPQTKGWAYNLSSKIEVKVSINIVLEYKSEMKHSASDKLGLLWVILSALEEAE